jgi:hypothetical protein
MSSEISSQALTIEELLKETLRVGEGGSAINIPVGISRLGLIKWLRDVNESKKAGGTLFKSPPAGLTLYIRSLEWHSRAIKLNGDPVIEYGSKAMENADLAFNDVLQEINALEKEGKGSANSEAKFNSPTTKYDNNASKTSQTSLKNKGKEKLKIYIAPPAAAPIGKGQPGKRSDQVIGPQGGSFMPPEIFGDYREAAGKFSGPRGNMSDFAGYKMVIDTSNIIPPDIEFNGANARPISTVNITKLVPKTPNEGINELIARSKIDPVTLALNAATIPVSNEVDDLEILDKPLETKKTIKLLVPVTTKESGLSLLEGIDVTKINASGRGKDVYKVEDLKKIARRFGLPTSGSKAQIVENIEEYLRKNGVDLEAERSKDRAAPANIPAAVEEKEVKKPRITPAKELNITIEDIPAPNKARTSKRDKRK